MDRAPAMAHDRFALDLANRWKDEDGRLHVRLNHISKANVCPYRGAEIPGFEALGLDPEKVYNLYRDPDELKKAAPTFNNLQVLSRHIPVSADDPQKDLVVGSTGTDAAFNHPYLDNSMVIWDAGAIDGVESEKQREISCGYRYVADMTPGTRDGLTFDGVMREIRGNHVALVPEGRAGRDVVVGDSAQSGGINGVQFSMKLNSRKAIMAQGALTAFLAPMLAQDAKVDLSPALRGVTAKNFKSKRDEIYGAVTRLTKGKLAQDADVSGLVELLDGLSDIDSALEGDDMLTDPVVEPDPEATAIDEDGDVVAKIMDFLKGKLSEEDLAALAALVQPGATDEPPPFEGSPETGAKEAEKVDRPAMDAAIKRAEKAIAKRFADIRTAENAVRPYIGELKIAMDSADDIYRMALESVGVNLDGVHPSAFPAMLSMVPVPGSERPKMAHDSKGAADFNGRFPAAARIKRL